MINESLYHKTVNILFDAYFNDTLQHGNCYACAVGNLIAANNGIEIFLNPVSNRLNWGFQKSFWQSVHMVVNSGCQVFNSGLNTYLGEQQLKSTGYKTSETAKIELAFEKANKGKSDEDYMFNGLVAVLEVLKEIHQVTDDDLLKSNHSRFEQHYKSKYLIQSP